MAQHLVPADYLVVAIYLAGTMALGLYLGRNIRGGEDYFLAGRRLPWWAIGMSLVATDIGGTDIIGVGGAAYQHGMVIWAILFALLLARLSESSGIYAIFQTLMAFFQGPALAVLLGGLL